MVEGSLLQLQLGDVINLTCNPIVSPNHDKKLRYRLWPLSEGYMEALLSDRIKSHPLYADEI